MMSTGAVDNWKRNICSVMCRREHLPIHHPADSICEKQPYACAKTVEMWFKDVKLAHTCLSFKLLKTGLITKQWAVLLLPGTTFHINTMCTTHTALQTIIAFVALLQGNHCHATSFFV